MFKLPIKDQHDISSNERQLRKLDRRDIALKSMLVLFAVVVIALNLLALTRINFVADGNKRNLIEQQEQNEDSHHEIKNYIRCVLLLRFDMTEEERNDREAVAAALDVCAQKETNGE